MGRPEPLLTKHDLIQANHCPKFIQFVVDGKFTLSECGIPIKITRFIHILCMTSFRLQIIRNTVNVSHHTNHLRI